MVFPLCNQMHVVQLFWCNYINNHFIFQTVVILDIVTSHKPVCAVQFELRAFFSTAISATEAVSADAAKQKIKELIAAESPQHPLSDTKLEALLQEQGITLARRTIAKYREQLKILPASLRKRR